MFPTVFDSNLRTLPMKDIASLVAYHGSELSTRQPNESKNEMKESNVPSKEYIEDANEDAETLSGWSNQEIKDEFDKEFKNEQFVTVFGHAGNTIKKRTQAVLEEGRKAVITALVLKQFPKITYIGQLEPIPEIEQTVEGYFLDLIGRDSKEIENDFDLNFKNTTQAPGIDADDKNIPFKTKYPKENLNDDYSKAVALLMKRFPNLTAQEIVNVVFDPRNFQFNGPETPAKSELSHRSELNTPARYRPDVIPPAAPGSGNSSRIIETPPQTELRLTPPSTPSKPPTEDFLQGYREIHPEGKEKEVREQRPEISDAIEIEKDTRDALNYIADLWNIKNRQGDPSLKKMLSRTFNATFANVPDNRNVPTWSNQDKSAVGIHKSAAKAKYYKKIEALVLYQFPKADLTNVSISFGKSDEHPYGLGLPKPKIPKHKAAGRYLVHIPSLQKGYLYIQYPSGWRIQHFKKRPISSDMQTMIWNMVDDKEFDSKLYKKLKAEEKKLYDEVVHMIRIPVNEIKGLGLHKKMTDVERDQCMKQLKILSGEIMAGSNSKKTIKDLKILVLKMLDKGYISRADANKIIYQLLTVEE